MKHCCANLKIVLGHRVDATPDLTTERSELLFEGVVSRFDLQT